MADHELDSSMDEDAPAQLRKPSWLPPAADAAGEYNMFGRDFEEHFWVPRRLFTRQSREPARLFKVGSTVRCSQYSTMREASPTRAATPILTGKQAAHK